jgi:hypothetical protein
MGDRNWRTAVRKWSAGLAIFAMVAGGVGLATLFVFGDHSQPAARQTPKPRTTLPPPPPSVPTPKEFTVGVVVTAQNCPPNAACVYTYTIEPKYIGLHPLPPTEFTVEYQVTGGHQPQPGKFTVQGDQARIMKDVTLEGPPGAQLQAVVTQVIG